MPAPEESQAPADDDRVIWVTNGTVPGEKLVGLLNRGAKCELEDIYHILPRPGSPATTCAAQTLVDFIEHEMRNALG